MKRTNVLTCLLCLLCVSCVSHASFRSDERHGGAPENLEAKIYNILNSPELESAQIGIKVVSLKTGREIFNHNARKLFVPASNLKLVTALAALKILNPEYRFRTELFADGGGGTIGNLYLKGSGDPSLSYGDLARMTMELSGAVKTITGSILCDASVFDDIPYGEGWMWDEGLAYYSAPVSGINLDRNCIDVCFDASRENAAFTLPPSSYAACRAEVSAISGKTDIAIARLQEPGRDIFVVKGSISVDSPPLRRTCSVSRPALYAGRVVGDLTALYGIDFKGGVGFETVPPQATSLVVHESKPLREIVAHFLKNSDNLTGECLLKTLGVNRKGTPGTSENGVEAVREMLSLVGMEKNAYRIVDGSGLSRYNLVSPSLLVGVLEHAYKDFAVFPEFMAALPLAGVDGTLGRRLKGDGTERKIRAKTGTMSGISSISGYLSTERRDILAVSIMMNGFTGSSAPFKKAQDDILALLAQNL